MLRIAGFHQLYAAAFFRFCFGRADAAKARQAVWAERAEFWRRYGEDA